MEFIVNGDPVITHYWRLSFKILIVIATFGANNNKLVDCSVGYLINAQHAQNWQKVEGQSALLSSL